MYLQVGWGMMEHCRHLVRTWGRGTVILSPRDLTDDQLERFAHHLRREGAAVLLDPQFYLPHADHERLRSHEYWPDEYASTPFWAGAGMAYLLTSLIQLNRSLGCDDIILPGPHATVVDDDWLAREQSLVEEAARINGGRSGLIATVALGEEATRQADQIHAILDLTTTWPVKGVYVVCEHPRGEYLVDDPVWLANVLDLTAGLRMQGKEVILGYCQHQMLIAACTSATAIASGTWMNVRSFPPEKFRLQYEDERKQRTTWYYSPTTLSEFRITFLDLAQRQTVLSYLITPDIYGSHYADAIFSGPQPSSVGFTEQDAFRHYLQCLHKQTEDARKPTFDATCDAYEQLLDQAAAILEHVHRAGVTGQRRDFGEIVDVNRAALRVLQADRGPMLRRRWTSL